MRSRKTSTRLSRRSPRRSDMDLTQEVLKEWLTYDPLTGGFKWAKSRVNGKVKIGRKAGCLHPDGYIKIRLFDRMYRCARLAVLYMTGEFPEAVDHQNLNRADDRWENLRVATRSQNQYNRPIQSNNKCGFKGVFWNRQARKWQAQIGTANKSIYLGRYPTPEEAHEAYVTAAKTLHGEFARTQ